MTETSPPAADVTAAADSIGGPNPIVGFRRKDLTDSLGAVLAEAARNPKHTATSLGTLAKAAVGAVRGRTPFRPAPKDRRFADPAWSDNFIYRRLLQVYLAADQQLDDWIGGTELSDIDRERARFVLSLALDALAPSNLPVNPLAIKRFVDTGGSSAVFGFQQFVADLRHNGGMPSQVDPTEFTVGEDIAATEGAVVFRNEVLELIQYTPRAERVHERPLVIAPPQINKFYVFDLTAEKSLVQYALDGGQQVFMISWRNPTTAHRDWDLGTYITAAEEAIEAATAISGSPDVNLLGACSGGMTAVALAAYLAARKKSIINALTVFVSVFDTASDRTLLGTFTTEETLAAAKRRSHSSGVLDGRELGRIFSMMRPNELIFSYWVNNYLLGKRPPAFDVLHWNNDNTRLPAALHGQFIDIYRDNLIATPGAVEVNGTPIDLRRIEADAFVMGGTTDHITPWDACYRSSLRLSGDVEFVLSNSGHIQSILNPPANPKATHFRNSRRPATAKEWQAGAEKVAGSWWPHWLEWLAARAGDQKDAPKKLGADGHEPLGKAPGSYVHG